MHRPSRPIGKSLSLLSRSPVMHRRRALRHWLSIAATCRSTVGGIGVASTHSCFHSRIGHRNASGLTRLTAALCTFGCVGFAASSLASASTSASCSSKPAPAPASSSSDDAGGGTDSSSTHFFAEPIKALHKAAAVLFYATPEPPPTVHTPQPPDGPLPKLSYPVVLVHGFLGYSSLLTNPINKQPVFEYFGELRSLLEGAGHTVIVPVLPRSYKVERRAKALQVALGLTAVSAEVVADTHTADGGRQTQKQTPVHQSDKRDVQQAKHDERAVPAASSEGSEDEGVTVLTNNRIDLASYKGPFHIIAHSMGGLDSRFLITHLQPEEDNRVLSLTTIGSPHRGSPIADLIVEQVQKDRTLPIPAPTFAAPGKQASDNNQRSTQAPHDTGLPTFRIEQVVAFISNTFSLDFRGMLDLSTSACADFNEHTPNRADTHYRSYSGYRPFDAWSVWYLPGKLIEAREGYNDGLVSVHSAQWGTHVGTVPLDHLQQVGLGVMHRHVALYKEIVWELHRIEQRSGRQQRTRQAERERGTRKQGSASEQQRHEDEAAQRAEESRDRAQEKGSDDASRSKPDPSS